MDVGHGGAVLVRQGVASQNLAQAAEKLGTLGPQLGILDLACPGHGGFLLLDPGGKEVGLVLVENLGKVARAGCSWWQG